MVLDATWEGLVLGRTPVAIGYEGSRPWQPPEDRGGTGIEVLTNLGPIRCLYHEAPSAERAVVWVSGAYGGFSGGGGLYSILSDELIADGLSSLRLDYRHPNILHHSIMDVLAGVDFLRAQGCERVALVGHSFGGAVVIAAAPLADAVATVVGLASQTHGARYAHLVSPRPLLLAHGEDDERLTPRCSILINEWAREPKRLILYPRTGHNLRECRDKLHPVLKSWLLDNT